MHKDNAHIDHGTGAPRCRFRLKGNKNQRTNATSAPAHGMACLSCCKLTTRTGSIDTDSPTGRWPRLLRVRSGRLRELTLLKSPDTACMPVMAATDASAPSVFPVVFRD